MFEYFNLNELTEVKELKSPQDKFFNTYYIEELPDNVFKRDCYVCFSGGADSTLLLDQVAERCNKVKGKCIAVSYNATHYSQPKFEIEELKRNIILDELCHRGRMIEQIKLKLEFMNYNYYQSFYPDTSKLHNMHAMQQLSWIANAALLIKNNSSLFLGYTFNDSTFWRFGDKFQSLIKNIISIANIENLGIYLPLADKPKHLILSKLHDMKLLDKVWSCETLYKDINGSKRKPCGQCSSCVENIKALILLNQVFPTNEKYDWVRDILKNDYDIIISRNTLNNTPTEFVAVEETTKAEDKEENKSSDTNNSNNSNNSISNSNDTDIDCSNINITFD